MKRQPYACRYLMVTTNAAAAGMVAPLVVNTTELAEVAPQEPARFGTFEAPAKIDEGVIDGAKKPFGYKIVIVAPGGNKVVGVKLSVMGTEGFRAMRSFALILSDTIVT